MGLVRYRAQDDQEADAEEAAGGQDGVVQTNARPHCQDRSMVEADAQRAPELLCRFREQPEPVVVLQRGAMALAQVAQTTQPACIHELGEVHQRARRDLCGGRSAMAVPTATLWVLARPAWPPAQCAARARSPP